MGFFTVWKNVTLLFSLSSFLTWDETRGPSVMTPVFVLCQAFVSSMRNLKFYSLTNHSMSLLFVEGQPVLGWERSAVASDIKA